MVAAGSTPWQQPVHPESIPGQLQATTGNADQRIMRSQLDEALEELQAAMSARDRARLQAGIRIVVEHMASTPTNDLQIQKVTLLLMHLLHQWQPLQILIAAVLASM